jgi:hypothetical protein
MRRARSFVSLRSEPRPPRRDLEFCNIKSDGDARRVALQKSNHEGWMSRDRRATAGSDRMRPTLGGHDERHSTIGQSS